MSTEKEKQQMLTVQDAAKDAGVKEDTVRKALAQGRLPHTVLYGRKLIDRADWEAYRANAKPGRPKKTDTQGAV
jgi:excisionase family DNA binding protein